MVKFTKEQFYQATIHHSILIEDLQSKGGVIDDKYKDLHNKAKKVLNNLFIQTINMSEEDFSFLDISPVDNRLIEELVWQVGQNKEVVRRSQNMNKTKEN